ncbi:hypothetical protein D3C81_2075170 [compost metagenome]
MPVKQVFTHTPCAAIGVQMFIARQTITLLQILQQFSHQHRGITLAVILNGAANKADVQPLLSRQNRFQEQVTVIITAAAVTAFHLLRHQIKA